MHFTPRKSFVFFVCLQFLCITTVFSESTLINFKEIDLTDAGRSGKKIMVSFTADWCLPCKTIRATLFNDPEIATLVNDNFQPVMVDVDSALGESWNDDFNVHYLPSIIFTNASGIEFERTKGSPSKKEFLTTLKRIINIEKVPYRAHNYTIVETSVMSPTGREIQLGAFSKPSSAERRILELRAFEDNNYIIVQEETNGRLLYKVVHRGLLSDAESKIQLKQYHLNGFEAFLRPD